MGERCHYFRCNFILYPSLCISFGGTFRLSIQYESQCCNRYDKSKQVLNFKNKRWIYFWTHYCCLSFAGIATGTGWIIWYFLQDKRRSYRWKILLFQLLVAISLLLEVKDFPPLFWVLDAHALWHLSTVLPTILLYR